MKIFGISQKALSIFLILFGIGQVLIFIFDQFDMQVDLLLVTAIISGYVLHVLATVWALLHQASKSGRFVLGLSYLILLLFLVIYLGDSFMPDKLLCFSLYALLTFRSFSLFAGLHLYPR